MTKNVETVQNIYAAFGRADLPTILAALAEDVAWEYQPMSTDVPWLAPRNGRASVAGFFETLMKELEIRRFEVKAIAESARLVVGVIDLEGVVRRTNRPIHEVDEAHLWHFDDAGRVVKFRHSVDTHAHWLAWHAK